MTLVFAVSDEHAPAILMAGDIMLSRDIKIGGEPPLGREIRAPNGDTYEVSVSQKLVKLHDRVFLGWAGELCAGERLIQKARSLIRSIRSLSADGLNTFRIDLQRFHVSEGLRCGYIVAILIDRENSDQEVFLSGCCTQIHIGASQPALAIGDGVVDFAQFMRQRGGIKAEDGRSSSSLNIKDFMVPVLDFLSRATSEQPITGLGLDNRWGLGSELLSLKSQGKLAKIDRILYQSYFRTKLNGLTVLLARGDKVFNYYDKDDLVILRQSPDRKRHNPILVTSPDRKFSEADLRKKIIATSTTTAIASVDMHVVRLNGG